jgi:hypothetical protein
MHHHASTWIVRRYAARRIPSIRISHAVNWFQLALVWSTILRSRLQTTYVILMAGSSLANRFARDYGPGCVSFSSLAATDGTPRRDERRASLTIPVDFPPARSTSS